MVLVDRLTETGAMQSLLDEVREGSSGVLVLLNCEESADQLFDQFDALNSAGKTASARQGESEGRSGCSSGWWACFGCPRSPRVHPVRYFL